MNIFKIDAADCHYGDAYFIFYFSEQIDPSRASGVFCRGMKYGPEAYIVGAGLLGFKRLFDAVCGDADYFSLAKDFAGFFYRQVVLAEMHSVGVNGKGDIGIIIYYEYGIVFPGKVFEFDRFFVDLPS